MEKPRILIVEDNADTRRFLEAMLSKAYEIVVAENGVTGVEYARTRAPNLILLDIMLPVLSGFDACSLLKKDERTKRIPIIFLSAKNSITDVTHGLAQGADDYIPKPFDYKELQARIEARLRINDGSATQPVRVGELTLEPATKIARLGGRDATLTTTEFEILRCLATKAGEVVSRDKILNEVWKDEAASTSDRTIDVHIRAIRKKLPPLTKHIFSIYGVGYRYNKE